MRIAAIILTLLLVRPAPAGEPEADGPARLEAILSAPVPAAEAEAAFPPGALAPEVRVRVTSPRHTILSSQVSGRIDAIAVRDGERFEAGQVLVEIDPTFENIQLERALATLRRHEVMLRITEELVELQSKGEAELELARSDVAQAAADADYIRARLDRMRIRVPFSGRVGEVAVREFQVVSEGQPLLEVIDDSVMELEFIVSSLWMRWFTPGFAFRIHIDEVDKSYDAVLVRLGGKVDPLSKSVNAYARITEHDPLLMEGMSGEAFIAPPDGGRP